MSGLFRNKIVAVVSLVFLLLRFTQAQNMLESQLIFALQEEHSHGSSIVELPNGDLLAAWFQGNGERWADDVRIMGARLLKDSKKWSNPFLLADVPGFPDINPVLFLDTRKKLWLVWYTVIANQWETSLIKYRNSENYMQQEGAPEWNWQDVLHVKPGDKTERGIQPYDRFVKTVEEQQKIFTDYLIEQGATNENLQEWEKFKEDILAKARGNNMIRKGRLIINTNS